MNIDAKDELRKVLDLLEEEKQEDLSMYNQQILRTDLSKRVKSGTSLYPVQVKDTGFGLGAQPFIVVQCKEDQASSNNFSSGKSVSVFSEKEGSGETSAKGIVNYMSNGEMKILLYEDELPDWIDLGRIGVNLLFDDRPYREMKRALGKAQKAERDRLWELREILYGNRKASFDERLPRNDADELNESQNEAVYKIRSANDVAIVHGPPGTGKTTTLVEAMYQLAQDGKKILACAPSNAAADLLTRKLEEKRMKPCRVGNISRVDPELLALTLEVQLYNAPEAKEIKKMKRQAKDFRKMAGKYKRNFGPAEREQRRQLYSEARDLFNQVKLIEAYLIDKIVSSADVVVCTLVGAAHKYVNSNRFDVLFIDEAAQALEGSNWIPIGLAEKVVLAGDPFQLPPTVKSVSAGKKGLSTTLIEKCLKTQKEVFLLNTQYRMHEDIMGFSNQYFYKGKLKAHETVAQHHLDLDAVSNMPLEFIDTAGCGFEEKRNPASLSFFNPEEYGVLWKHLEQLLICIPQQDSPSIGIISPYKEQVRYIRKQVENYFQDYPHVRMEVNTIDSFQGQERDIIYLSLVRSNEKSTIGFLSDYRRMNVAMTRARKKLVIIGDSATIGSHGFYNKFIDYAQERYAYRSAWEFA